jgi:hypothetical protein
MKKIKCKICNLLFLLLGLPMHVNRCHNMTLRQYYDKFEKNKNEGKCLNCDKQTRFITILSGYGKFCSSKCANTGKFNPMYGKVRPGSLAGFYGKVWDTTHRSNISKRVKKQWKNIEIRKIMSKGISIATKKRFRKKEERDKISKALTGKKQELKTIRSRVASIKITVANRSDKKDQEIRKTMSQAQKLVMLDPVIGSKKIRNLIKASGGESPNQTELMFQLLLDEHFPLHWYFVGDGHTMIGGRSPDFISFSQNKIIELFGSYWHRGETSNTIKNRKDIFKRYGYKTLIVWESELKNEDKLIKKLVQFNRGV